MSGSIQQVDEKLENDGVVDKKETGIGSIFQELSSVNRQANKIINRTRQHHLEPSSGLEPKTQTPNQPKQKVQSSGIGKYNYYGKKYRFQQKEQELHIEVPKFQRQCATENNSPKASFKGVQSEQGKGDNLSTLPVPSDHMFVSDGQIEFPSNNYYIYFDKGNPKGHNHKNKQIKNKQGYSEQVIPQKFKPAWVMEKKINSLQKQVNKMKENEKKMGATMESVLIQTGSIKPARRTVDFPIQIKSNVERMVESLIK